VRVGDITDELGDGSLAPRLQSETSRDLFGCPDGADGVCAERQQAGRRLDRDEVVDLGRPDRRGRERVATGCGGKTRDESRGECRAG
jgi:hypothetical protein